MGAVRRLPEVAQPGLDRDGEWHDCVICRRAGVRRFGSHGIGVSLKNHKPGRWYCGEHREHAVLDDVRPGGAGQRQGVLL